MKKHGIPILTCLTAALCVFLFPAPARGEEIALLAAAMIDHPVRLLGGAVTGMYGVVDAGEHNVSVLGIGFRARASSRTRVSLEHRTEVASSDTHSDLSQWAVGAQYRLARDWSCNAAFVFSDGGYWEAGNGFRFRLGASYHTQYGGNKKVIRLFG